MGDNRAIYGLSPMYRVIASVQAPLHLRNERLRKGFPLQPLSLALIYLSKKNM